MAVPPSPRFYCHNILASDNHVRFFDRLEEKLTDCIKKLLEIPYACMVKIACR
jgi:hypothetical protein